MGITTTPDPIGAAFNASGLQPPNGNQAIGASVEWALAAFRIRDLFTIYHNVTRSLKRLNHTGDVLRGEQLVEVGQNCALQRRDGGGTSLGRCDALLVEIRGAVLWRQLIRRL